MKKSLFFCLALFSFLALTAQTGEHVWSFAKGPDSDDGAIRMKLRGPSVIEKMPDGNCLSIRSDGKKAAGIIADKHYPDLSPAGAFRAEFTVIVTALPDKNQWLNLLDNQYVNYKSANGNFNRGLQLYLTCWPAWKGCIPTLSLGLGNGKSAVFSGGNLRLETGKVHTLAFSWDGYRTAEFYLDGKLNRRVVSEKKCRMAPAVYATVIGDRWGAGYNPFPGKILRVKFTSFAPKEAELTLCIPGRKVFLRNEKNAALSLSLENEDTVPLTGLEITGTLDGRAVSPVTAGDLKPGEKKTVSVPVETRLMPGKRQLNLTVFCRKNGKKIPVTLTGEYGIAPLVGDRMPAVMWGGDLSHKLFLEYGFTHRMGYMFSGHFTRRTKERFDVVQSCFSLFDDYLMDGFRAVDCFNILSLREYPIVDRQGKNWGNVPRINPVDPRAQALVEHVAEEATKAFGQHPAMEGANLNMETRDGSRPSFSDADRQRWKEFSGTDRIPDFVRGRAAPSWKTTPGFPAGRIISEEDPVFRYYKWWWTCGDGWNEINTKIHQHYRKNFPHGVWTFHDPAVRVPPFWGSGGKVDRISHWSYANPDPVNVGVVSAELSAMARGMPGQKIMNMTQVIIYRSETAPKNSKAEPPEELKKHPDAAYITLPPDMMRIALWTQLSRQAEAFMIFGQNALFPNPNPKGSYQCTNHETRQVVKEILLNVIRPFGPVLRRLPERPSEIAVLESGASAVYADRGTWGWSGWPFQLHLGLLWANLQPKVIYEEEIVRDGLGKVRVLVMPYCDVLTAGAARKIQEFQAKGGIIAADSCVAPSILPDIDVPVVRRTADKPLEGKKALQEAGLRLRNELKGQLTFYTESSDPDLMTWVRSHEQADYLFVVNDKRIMGRYLGQYGRLADQGVPAAGTVSVARKCGAVYDLLLRKEVPFRTEKGRTVIPVQFAGAGGKMLLLLPEKIGELKLDLPRTVKAGGTAGLEVRIFSVSGKPLKSLHPVRITVRDSRGRVIDDSGYGAAEQGVFRQTMLLPLDAPAGEWTVTVQELASGKTAERKFTLAGK